MYFNIIKATQPTVNNEVSVFLAGSIDNGQAVNWQRELPTRIAAHADKLIKSDHPWRDVLETTRLTVYDPRRDAWNPDAGAEELHTQIDWELRHLDKVDLVVVYFSAESKAPVTMLELGTLLRSRRDGSVVVCIEPGFYRRDNLEMTIERYGKSAVRAIVDSMDHTASMVVTMVHNHLKQKD